MASHVAASAFGHCLVLVRDEATATRLAVIAVRRGGRSLGAALGHARHQALAAVAADPPGPVTLGPGAGPTEVAWALAATRPPLELALIDLGGRYRLGRAGLGIALRLSPSAAADRVAAVARAWDEELDPALLAWLGPGDCGDLAAILDGRVRDDVSDLLDVAGEVAEHTAGCQGCADRQRAMSSVRLLLAGAPLAEPPVEVVVAASGSRLQPPVPPPGLQSGPSRIGQRVLAAAVVVMAVAGVAGVALDARGRPSPAADSLQALTRLPAGVVSLRLAPASLAPGAPDVVVTNASSATVRWEATTDVPWLEVSPATGSLRAGAARVLRLQGSPPEGDVRASIRVGGDDGSTAVATVAGTVEHPPDLDALADGCRVTADVEDESEVALTLHWRAGSEPEASAAMTAPVNAKAFGTLPAGRAPLTWWVSAVDGRGNQARTGEVFVPAGC